MTPRYYENCRRLGGNEMQRYKRWIFLGYFILSIISITACGQEKNHDSASNFIQNKTNESEIDDISKNQEISHLSINITNNMVIDADIENKLITQSMIYQTSYREFDVDKVKQLLLADKNKLNISKNGKSTIIESSNGELLIIGEGGITYTSSESIWDLQNFILQAYYSELDYGIPHGQELKEIEQESIVQNVEKNLKNICGLTEGEDFSLKSAVKIDRDAIIKKQEQLKEKLKDAGTYQDVVDAGFFYELEKDWNPKKCYYLSFVMKKNDIPLASSNEPSIRKRDENAITELTDLEVIVNENGIQLLYITGIFDLKEISEEKIMSVQESAALLQQKYDLQIITEPHVVNKIWLEYLFVNDPSTLDSSQGTLEPYWCFQIKGTEEYEGIEDVFFKGERFHAVRGEDFVYE